MEDLRPDSIFEVDYKNLKEKGVKYILFDVDNTIVGIKDCELNSQVILFFEELKKYGFEIVLFSNNFPKRVKELASEAGVECFSLVLKPLPFSYIKFLKEKKAISDEVCCIGNQRIVDTLGAKMANISQTIVVKSFAEDKVEKFLKNLFDRKINGNISKTEETLIEEEYEYTGKKM